MSSEAQRRAVKKYGNSMAGKLRTYKANARRRNLNFSLSDEEFASFWGIPCTYCGDSIETVGIDRIDNYIGYEIDNVVSCCRTCNFMKTNMDNEDFILHIKKISRYQNSSGLRGK